MSLEWTSRGEFCGSADGREGALWAEFDARRLVGVMLG